MTQAWAFISIAGERQYAGNLGYQDNPQQLYRYDSLVPNHLQVAVGDLVVVRNRESVLGVSRIDQIISSEGTKIRLKCPSCGTHRISERHFKLPRWRCVNGDEFANPAKHTVRVHTYEARYGANFVSLTNSISVSDLKRAAPRPSDQLSIEKIDIAILADKITLAIPEASDLLARHLQATRPATEDYEGDRDNGITGLELSYIPGFADTREWIKRSIALRRGQRAFRNRLIRRYGPFCMISECQLLDIVEAAHIWPYRNDADNHAENGLLLRADLHTLFDLDLIGIQPDNLSVHLHPAAAAVGYCQFNSAAVRLSGRARPSARALKLRWGSFLERLNAPESGPCIKQAADGSDLSITRVHGRS